MSLRLWGHDKKPTSSASDVEKQILELYQKIAENSRTLQSLLETGVPDATMNIETYKLQLERLQGNLDTLKSTLGQLEEALSPAPAVVKAGKDRGVEVDPYIKVQEMANDFATNLFVIETQVEKLGHNKATKGEMYELIDTVATTKKELEGEINSIHSEVTTTKDKLETEINSIHTELDDTKNDLEAELNEVHGDVANLKKDQTTKGFVSTAIQKEVTPLKKELERLRESHLGSSWITSQLKPIRAELDGLKDSHLDFPTVITSQLRPIREEVQKLKADTSTKSDLSAALEQFHSLSDTLTALKNNEVIPLKTEVEGLRKKHTDSFFTGMLTSHLRPIKEEIRQLRDDTSTKSDLSTALEQFDSLSATLTALKKPHEDSPPSARMADVENVNKSITELKHMVSQLQKLLGNEDTGIMHDVEILKEHCPEIGQINTLTDKIDGLISIITEFRATLGEDADDAGLIQDVKELEDFREECEEVLESLKEKVTKCPKAAQITQLLNQINNLNEMVSKYKEQLNVIASESRDTDLELDARMKELEKNVDAIIDIKGELEKELKGWKESQTVFMTALTNDVPEIRKLRKQADIYHPHITKNGHDITKLEKELLATKTRLDTLDEAALTKLHEEAETMSIQFRTLKRNLGRFEELVARKDEIEEIIDMKEDIAKCTKISKDFHNLNLWKMDHVVQYNSLLQMVNAVAADNIYVIQLNNIAKLTVGEYIKLNVGNQLYTVVKECKLIDIILFAADGTSVDIVINGYKTGGVPTPFPQRYNFNTRLIENSQIGFKCNRKGDNDVFYAELHFKMMR